MKHIVTKYETIRRTEKIEYLINIPEGVKNKEKYADNKIVENKYSKCRVVDIVDSEILDEEIVGIKAVKKPKC